MSSPTSRSTRAKDKRVVAGLYSVAVSPIDGTVWGTSLGYPGYVVRVDPGPDPTHTALGEIYEPPFPGYGPRGGDIDRNGVFWASLASGHLASFDRKKCKVLNGPTATGKHCPEGWTLYPFPGPQFKDVTESGSAEASYYTWVDQFDTFGPRQERADRHRQHERRIAGARRRQIRRPCASPTRSAISPNGWTGASTTRTLAGRARNCGRPSRPGRCSTSRPARGHCPRSCGSSCVPIRSRTETAAALVSFFPSWARPVPFLPARRAGEEGEGQGVVFRSPTGQASSSCAEEGRLTPQCDGI